MRPHRLAQRSFNGLRVLALVAIVGLAPAALRADGIELPPRSRVADLVPAEQLERQAAFQYERMRKDAESQRALDDEIAFVMGHEIAHALREHGRERQSKAMIAQGLSIGASILSQVMGYGDIGGQVARGVSNVTMLKFSRDDESEADLLGMDLSARAGYDPSAGISLWEKMSAAPSSQGAPPQWLSTHPSHESRIADIRKALPKVLPLYERSKPR
ncbi:MAG: M48 family peptidase [Betaproteobacteria bacterium]|nr:M48 family peptidase [Betaproteobacteria bacterium]